MEGERIKAGMTWTEQPVDPRPEKRHELTQEILDGMRALGYPDGALFSVQLALVRILYQKDLLNMIISRNI